MLDRPGVREPALGGQGCLPGLHVVLVQVLVVRHLVRHRARQVRADEGAHLVGEAAIRVVGEQVRAAAFDAAALATQHRAEP